MIDDLRRTIDDCSVTVNRTRPGSIVNRQSSIVNSCVWLILLLISLSTAQAQSVARKTGEWTIPELWLPAIWRLQARVDDGPGMGAMTPRAVSGLKAFRRMPLLVRANHKSVIHGRVEFGLPAVEIGIYETTTRYGTGSTTSVLWKESICFLETYPSNENPKRTSCMEQPLRPRPRNRIASQLSVTDRGRDAAQSAAASGRPELLQPVSAPTRQDHS